jgi:hypothetical protein
MEPRNTRHTRKATAPVFFGVFRVFRGLTGSGNKRTGLRYELVFIFLSPFS